MIEKTIWIKKNYNKNFNQITMDFWITIFGPSLEDIPTNSTENFKQIKPPYGFFCPHVQFDQSAILDKSIRTQLFWLGLFGWSFWLGFFY